MCRLRNRVKAALLASIVGALAIGAQPARAAVLIESFENTTDGWSIYQAPYTSAGFSTTTGVTNGTYSWNLTGTAGPDYSAMLGSAQSAALTTLLGNSASVSIDVLTTPGSFSFFQQWTLAVNNTDTGYQSVDGYTYSQSPTIGSQSTLTWTIPPAIRNTLATSANTTAIVFQVGGGNSAGNNSMFLDNVRATLLPESGSATLLAGAALTACMRRRRKLAST